MKKEVSILIPTMFDSRYVIELCLKTIKKYTVYSDYKIIVCDAGVNEETFDYLSKLQDSGFIKLIKANDWRRPKDELVKIVDSEFYLLLHDDVRIFKYGWLEKRLDLMNRDKNNAFVGTIAKNYNNGKRIFPLGLLAKTSVTRELNIKWGKEPEQGLDTGAIAYKIFFSQKKYKFVNYKFSKDIYHYWGLTWPKYHTEKTFPGIDKKLKEREDKLKEIREILNKGSY